MPFPETRLRRLRRTPALRRAFAETRIDPAGLVLPIFVKDGVEGEVPISSMPGVAQHDVDSALALARRAADVGVGGVILFGIPATKDADGTGGWDPQGPVPRAARAMKDALGDDLVVWADVCQCEYTDHGHCGPLDARGQVVNDAAVEAYVRDALTYADAGIDVVAPSGMMDGQVAAIRAGLDAGGFGEVVVVAYAAKYASAFYGPFREAAESTMVDGDRAGHQMDPANRREALLELAADVDEGADVLMVKPALAYLDVIADARVSFDVPVAAYQVSGEYAMLHAAAERGWLDGPRAMREAVVSIRRAGADLVLTYAAVELATTADA
ncbi:porphobilinogen synthase [Egicoccus halophilus]|uniref:Delta-aminolevulinic acid dehydratase n=1 Tax=Egicoccus halophilus TaxID=1670830 RepID=A0A8J3ADW2_9ACTN|nr:porphobilinogen synthase [Egicoccus halophilus]GGI05665.1 delta-aminolevulinic acid dehydratase [Egicoccus halophilus]